MSRAVPVPSIERVSRWAIGRFGNISTRLLQSPGVSGAGCWPQGHI